LLAAGAYALWYYNRPQPEAVERRLFEGVTYRREARRTPRPLVIHVLTVDLDAPGIRLRVTPGDPKAARPLKGQTTSQFLRESGAQVAVNGDFFYPWRSNHPLDYYPHVGDPVSVEGDAVSDGVRYATRDHNRGLSTLYVADDGRVTIDERPARVRQAIGGHRLRLNRAPSGADKGAKHPRTAAALDQKRRRLFLVVVDGRQPGYSEGVTERELAALLRELGAHSALNLDGGGSSTLVVADEKGRPDVLNSPIDHRIPGRERVVANHLAVYARPLPRR
jgi:Exopolysaccharide biosynthesis protein related to N-acetylglucosamine-1-phosphodiester alpha-N-acetylglucosaminidase